MFVPVNYSFKMNRKRFKRAISELENKKELICKEARSGTHQ